MGVDLENVDIAVLSHAHYDHSGGFDVFSGKNQKAGSLAAGKAVRKIATVSPLKGEIYWDTQRIFRRISRERLHLFPGDRLLVPASGALAIIWTIWRKKAKGRKCTVRKTGCGNLMIFLMSRALCLKPTKGLVIFNSCCHGGPGDIIREIVRVPVLGIWEYMLWWAAFI